MIPSSTPAKMTARPAMEVDSPIRRLLRLRNVNVLFLLIVLVGEIVLFSVMSPYFLSWRNAFNIGRAVSVTGIAAAFATILLISGGFDLSIGVVMNAAGVAAAAVVATQFGVVGALVVGLAVGILVGLINGVLVAKVGINALIATIGMTFVVRGVMYLLSGAKSGVISNEVLLFIGQGNIYVGSLRVPFALILMLICMLVVFLILNYIQFGKYVYAIGGNPVACRRAGIKVERLRIFIYVLSGASAAFAGLVLAGLTGAGVPYAAGGELSILSAVILGGTSLAGGIGTVQGTLLGVLVVGVLKNGMTLANVNAHWQMVAEGVVLLTAVAIDQLKRHA